MAEPCVPLFQHFGRYLMRLLLFLFAHSSVDGQEHVPATGGVILVANHLSYIDPPLLVAAMSRSPHFMAKRELWDNAVTRWLVNNFGAFPVRRGMVDRAALRRATAIVEAGGMVGMFPEGTRSRDARLHRANPGAALIALRTGAPLLPAAITGSQHALRFLEGKPPVRADIHVRFGPPFHLAPPERRAGAGQLQHLADEAMLHIARLLPLAYRGCYAEGVGRVAR